MVERIKEFISISKKSVFLRGVLDGRIGSAVQLDNEIKHGNAIVDGLEFAVPSRLLTVNDAMNNKGIIVGDSFHDLRRDIHEWSDNESKTRIMVKRASNPECTTQSFVCGISCVAVAEQLGTEIIHGDKTAVAILVGRKPVVASEADRLVLQPISVELPQRCKGLEDGLVFEVSGLRVHN